MKKFGLIVLAVICFILPLGIRLTGTAKAESSSLSVVATECFLYKNPSFDEKVVDENGPIKLKFGDIVSLSSGGQESEKFVHVSFGENVGYVFKYYLTDNTNEQDVYPVFNASVITQDAQVFDLEKNPTSITLEKGKELYLYEGYKKTEDGFTAVCFVSGDGHLYYGYLKTVDLQPYGINAGLITGLVVAASCVTIILLLIFMKKTKTKKKKAEKQ